MISSEQFLAAGNAVFVIPSAIVLLYAMVRRRSLANTHWGRVVVYGLLMALLAVCIRIGQWLLAQWTRVPPDYYGEWIFGVRDQITAFTAVLFTIGCSLSMAGLSRRGSVAAWVAGGLCVGIASAVVGAVLTP